MQWLTNADADTKAAAGVEVRYALQSDVDVGGVVAVVEHKEFHVRRSLRSTFHDAGVCSLLPVLLVKGGIFIQEDDGVHIFTLLNNKSN